MYISYILVYHLLVFVFFSSYFKGNETYHLLTPESATTTHSYITHMTKHSACNTTEMCNFFTTTLLQN